MRRLRPLLAMVLLLTVLPAFSQAARKRLILKDGSFQVVTKFEILGDRVRYTSAERDGQLEEMPYSLIDWPATDKWNKEHEPGGQAEKAVGTAAVDAASPAQSEAAEIDKEEQAARDAEKYRMPTIATGLRLPDESGVFALDTFQAIPELVHLDQSNGNINRDTGHNVLKAAINPLGGAKEPIRLDGASSKVQLHVAQPEIYVALDNAGGELPDSALTVNTGGANAIKDDRHSTSHSSPDSRYAIVRVESAHNLRTIGAMRISLLGKVSQSEEIIPTTAEILPGRFWMKLTPKYPLEFGEYALMEILGPGEVNLDVWDFGVNPNKPENRHAITPVHE